MNPMLTIAIDAARQAGKLITLAAERLDELKISLKKPNDYVTEVDQKAEQVIIDAIRKIYPNHAILAEESGTQAGDSDVTWIIDPLDGTTNFIRGFPFYCVSIAVKRRDRLECAVMYDPYRHDLFTAVRGQGAQLNQRRMRVTERHDLYEALLGTGFPTGDTDHLPVYLKTLEALVHNISDVRCAGAAALNLAYVAAGRLDGFWEIGLQPWDIAAGVLLVKEAGGLVGDLMGGETYLQSGNIVAGNIKVFKELLRVLHPIVKQHPELHVR
jgi:myo-inositol-1(or 4)-monophosphatase